MVWPGLRTQLQSHLQGRGQGLECRGPAQHRQRTGWSEVKNKVRERLCGRPDFSTIAKCHATEKRVRLWTGSAPRLLLVPDPEFHQIAVGMVKANSKPCLGSRQLSSEHFMVAVQWGRGPNLDRDTSSVSPGAKSIQNTSGKRRGYPSVGETSCWFALEPWAMQWTVCLPVAIQRAKHLGA